MYLCCRSWTSVNRSRSQEIEPYVNEWCNNSQTTYNSTADVTSINKWTKNDIKNPAGICEGQGERRHAMYDCRPTWSCLVRCDITHLRRSVLHNSCMSSRMLLAQEMLSAGSSMNQVIQEISGENMKGTSQITNEIIKYRPMIYFVCLFVCL